MEPIRITSGQERGRLHVFSIDDVDYYVDDPVPGSIALQFTEMVAEDETNMAAATVWLLRQVLGDDGYEALRDCPDVTTDQVTQITDRLVEHALGDVASPEGNSRAVRRSSPGSRGTGTTSRRTGGASTANGSGTRRATSRARK